MTVALQGLSPEQKAEALRDKQDPPIPGEETVVSIETASQSKPKKKKPKQNAAAASQEKPSKRNGSSKASSPLIEIDRESPLIGRTFRVPEYLLTAMHNASLKRKLAGDKQYSQQEILCQALAGWLQQEGEL